MESLNKSGKSEKTTFCRNIEEDSFTITFRL